MRKYVIMGVQGSGKGTQATLLARDLDLVHVSVGDIFRWHVQNHTKLGAQVRRTMRAGDLVDDELVGSVVRRRLDEHDWNYGFIIDGFPRNAAQAEFFLESYDIDGVIHLDLPDDEVRRRVLARRLCSRCGLDYNLIAQSPRQEGRCDVCDGELVSREDDTEHALAARLRDYHAKTNPALDLFRRKEFVFTVDARPDKEERAADHPATPGPAAIPGAGLDLELIGLPNPKHPHPERLAVKVSWIPSVRRDRTGSELEIGYRSRRAAVAKERSSRPSTPDRPLKTVHIGVKYRDESRRTFSHQHLRRKQIITSTS